MWKNRLKRWEDNYICTPTTHLGSNQETFLSDSRMTFGGRSWPRMNLGRQAPPASGEAKTLPTRTHTGARHRTIARSHGPVVLRHVAQLLLLFVLNCRPGARTPRSDAAALSMRRRPRRAAYAPPYHASRSLARK